MNRHLSRMVAMQTIYEWNFRPETDLSEILERGIAEFSPDIDKDFVKKVVFGIKDKKNQIDKAIADCAPEWPIEQISCIDKSILEIAIYELLNALDIPPKVSINEAVELAKQFGSENSSKFINGVLGTVYEKHQKEIEKKEGKNAGKNPAV